MWSEWLVTTQLSQGNINMKLFSLVVFGFLLVLSPAVATESDVTELGIEVEFKPDNCDELHKAAAADLIKVHYT